MLKVINKSLFLFPLITSLLWLLGLLYPAIIIYFEHNTFQYMYMDFTYFLEDLPNHIYSPDYSYYVLIYLLISLPGFIITIIIVVFAILMIVSSFKYLFSKKELENFRIKWKRKGLFLIYLQVIIYILIYGYFKMLDYLLLYTPGYSTIQIIMGTGGNLIIIGGSIAISGYILSYIIERVEKWLTPEELPAKQLASEELPAKQLASEEIPVEQINLEELLAEQLGSEELPAEQLSKKFCPECGTELTVKDKFCTICGYVFKESSG